ncbi:minor capsid protein [Lactobacillus sp. PV034]|uniref:minor capsid protein n=1 Tax=Lactobacillus sp. PV034 TaxID=2594495 RepID=UPI00223F9D04|nr:minor capsid protein [Lactobacillus sp. PV034]QNQ80792.1 hypothetical protein FP432_04100 [Lactobacillus sp. PV034]
MMKTNSYWRKRMIFAKQQELQSAADYELAMRNRLKQLENDMECEAFGYISRYAQENNTSLKNAAQALNTINSRHWRMTLEEFKAKAEKGGYKKELDTEYFRSRIARLQDLHDQLVIFAEKHSASEVLRMQTALSKEYSESYLMAEYSRQKLQGKLSININHFNERQVENIIRRPWQGSDFSKRIWRNYTKVLPDYLTDAILRGTLLGQSYSKITQEMRQRMTQFSENQIHRLVVTEMGHAQETANLDFYKDSKIEQYQYMATLESRTCTECGHLDVKIFKVRDQKTGINYPLIHPYCRCTTTPYDPALPDVETRWARDDNGKGHLIKNMTFDQWKNYQNVFNPKVDSEFKPKLTFTAHKHLTNSLPKTLRHLTTKSIDDFINKNVNKYDTDEETKRLVKINVKKQLQKIADISALPTVQVRMRVNTSDLESIINTGFKNQFETHKSGGLFDPARRKKATANLFNIPMEEVNNYKSIDFEKYGYLWDSRDDEPFNRNLNQYGSSKIIFKDSIKSRTTYNHGDSLGIKGMPLEKLAKPSKIGTINESYLRNLKFMKSNQGRTFLSKLWKDPYLELNENYDNINKFIKNKQYDYNEAQLHGHLTYKDIDYIIIPKDELTESLEKLLKNKKIKYKLEEVLDG